VGSLQCSPDPLAGFKEDVSRQEGNGGEGRERLGGGREEGKGAPLGSLQRSPDALAGFKRAASRQEGNGAEGKTRRREGRGEGRGMRGNAEGREKGEVRGNSALVVGG